MILDKPFLMLSCILICFSCCSAVPCVAALISSMLSLIPSSVLMYSSPASSPGPPKISARAAPTADELAGNSFNLAATCCITSNVVMLPCCNPCCTSSDEMPMFSSAVAVAVVISRILMFASLMASTPLSENTPCFVALVEIATNSSADSPASLKYRGYSFNVSIKSPFALAPLTSPSRTSCIASSMLMPKLFASVLAACNVSLNPVPKCSATACTLLRSFNISSPVFPVNWVVRMLSCCKPFSFPDISDKADETLPNVLVIALIACTPWLQLIKDFFSESASTTADERTFFKSSELWIRSLNFFASLSSLNVIAMVLFPAIPKYPKMFRPFWLLLLYIFSFVPQK